MCILKPASVGIVGTGGRHVGGWANGRICGLGELFSEAAYSFCPSPPVKSLALAVNSAWPNPARGGKVDDGGTRDGAMSAVTER